MEGLTSVDAIDTLGRDSRKLIKRVMTISYPRIWGEGDSPPGAWPRTQKPRLNRGFWGIDRATSYSPTHLRVQYHRG